MRHRVLLIEDDEVKRQSIQTVLGNSIAADLVHANSVHSAITALEQDFDLVLADMSLPTYDIELRERGGTPRPFGGFEVFEYLERVQSDVPVIVITSYPAISDGKRSMSVSALGEQLERDFPANFRGVVYFDSSYAEWEQQFVELLRKTTGVSR
jgi:CheY-like chemotaxis protein